MQTTSTAAVGLLAARLGSWLQAGALSRTAAAAATATGVSGLQRAAAASSQPPHGSSCRTQSRAFSSAPDEGLHVSVEPLETEGVSVLTLQRPDAKNAIGRQMLKEIIEAVNTLRQVGLPKGWRTESAGEAGEGVHTKRMVCLAGKERHTCPHGCLCVSARWLTLQIWDPYPAGADHAVRDCAQQCTRRVLCGGRPQGASHHDSD